MDINIIPPTFLTPRFWFTVGNISKQTTPLHPLFKIFGGWNPRDSGTGPASPDPNRLTACFPPTLLPRSTAQIGFSPPKFTVLLVLLPFCIAGIGFRPAKWNRVSGQTSGKGAQSRGCSALPTGAANLFLVGAQQLIHQLMHRVRPQVEVHVVHKLAMKAVADNGVDPLGQGWRPPNHPPSRVAGRVGGVGLSPTHQMEMECQPPPQAPWGFWDSRGFPGDHFPLRRIAHF